MTKESKKSKGLKALREENVSRVLLAVFKYKCTVGGRFEARGFGRNLSGRGKKGAAAGEGAVGLF